jgi:tetratricopeptide (TPR) repeat protein
MKLPTTQYQQIGTALLDAFDENSLAAMLLAKLGIKLANKVDTSTGFESVVWQLLNWAQQHDRVYDLVSGAKAWVPTNRKLKALPEQFTDAFTGKSDTTTEPFTLIANAPYGLDSDIVGREQELQLLNDWYFEDDKHPLLAMIGLGGMGKSALTWHWLQTIKQDGITPPLIVWWAFYEIDGTPDKLMIELLRHFGDAPEQFPSLRAAVNRVVQRLQTTPALIVLDGAERLLRAYHGLGAAYLGDGDEELPRDMYARARECVDPVAGYFLQWLANPVMTQAKTVVTSRLAPLELAGRSGHGLFGVRRHALTGLSPDAALALFHDLDVQATRNDVIDVCAPLGYHPLSLHLLARYVAGSPDTQNALRLAVDYDPIPDMLGKRQHILERAYDNLPPRIQLVLSRLAAFRSSITWDVIGSVMGRGKRVRDDLLFLEKRGLIRRVERHIQGKKVTQYELHPIVRRYAYTRLTDPAATHAQLASYFGDVPLPEKVSSVADLQPTIELYHHLARARKYDNAWTLYRDRLLMPIYYQLGHYQLQIECLLSLFPAGVDYAPVLSDKEDQSHACNELANSYSASGQPMAAIPLFILGNTIDEKRGDELGVAVGLGNLAHEQMLVGQLAAAVGNLRRSIAMGRRGADIVTEAAGHQGLGQLLALTGEQVEQVAELDAALQLFSAEKNPLGEGQNWAYWAQIALLQGQTANATKAAGKALELVNEYAQEYYPVEREYVRCHWLLGWAALQTASGLKPIFAEKRQALLDEAQEHIDEAQRRCRSIDLVELEPSILLAQARLVYARADMQGMQPLQEAHELADEARLVAERAGYVLDLADIHNFLAQLACDSGESSVVYHHAQQARDYAWCDGPPHAYQHALDEAERLMELVAEW